MKNKVIGILAHVDAGKTTLSEAMLYTAGKIKKLGRVDNRNTYLDTHELERERGITIFSKQALIDMPYGRISLLDTPGHVDFSAETERTLSVLDCAILVISASDGVQAHTETLWELLGRYGVPTLIFVTKTDMAGTDREAVMRDIRSRLGSGCVCFSAGDNGTNGTFAEQTAMCDEALLEKYVSGEDISDGDIARVFSERKIFPCFFGSGLRLYGIEELLCAIGKYVFSDEDEDKKDDKFSAKVYKIAHDKGGVRLTYMKITSGALRVRQNIAYALPEKELTEEKITSIRFYSGDKFETADSAVCGEVCAVTGLSHSYAGQILGESKEAEAPLLEPVLCYRISLPKETDAASALPRLRELEEEEPMLRLVWNEHFGEIYACLMGQVQCEIITRLIKERFDMDVKLEDGRIMYKESISAVCEGVGHFEPLRHYSEVHLMLEPQKEGTGVVICSSADEDSLEKSWQRLILSHLEEKQHKGVLTGSPLTDVKITLVSGRAHLKHTQSGDFREASYRAVRQGLMCLRAAGKCILKEPYYAFRLSVPSEYAGRAISDIINMCGSISEHDTRDGFAVLSGRAPVSTMNGYSEELAAYSHGKGSLACRSDGYSDCHNADEVIQSYGYVPEADTDSPCDSVFCSHGSGFIVPWYSVPEYAHLEMLKTGSAEEPAPAPKVIKENLNIDEKELDAIMDREFGPIRRRVYGEAKRVSAEKDKGAKSQSKQNLYIIDGYNVIFAWEELSSLADTALENAREALIDILENYMSFTKREIVLVFDAYRVKGQAERKEDRGGLHIVYTKEGELGDTYIERLIEEIGKDYSVRAVTSDGLIQLRALSSGVLRMSAREFREEVLSVNEEIREFIRKLRDDATKKHGGNSERS